MAVHLPRMLEAAGATAVEAVAAGALFGPSQVGARILEASLLRRFHPMISARISVALHPIGAGVLGLLGAGAAAAPFKCAYDACEAAAVLFLRKYGGAMRACRSGHRVAANAGQDGAAAP
jgi:hypothetical protein